MIGHVLTAAAARRAAHRSSRSSATAASRSARTSSSRCRSAVLAVQETQDGTGHAVRVALEALRDAAGTTDGHGRGDGRRHPAAARARPCAACAEDARGRGRGRSPCSPRRSRTRSATAGSCATRRRGRPAIVEEKDATPSRRRVARDQQRHPRLRRRPSSPTRCARITNDNAKGEYYLTDVVASPARTAAPSARSPHRRRAADRGRQRPRPARRRWPASSTAASWTAGCATASRSSTPPPPGSTSTWCSSRTSRSCPGVQLLGATVVAEDAVDRPRLHAQGRRGRRRARRSYARTASCAVIGAGANVGPFSYLRPGTELGAGGKIGALRGDQERRRSATAPRSRTCPTSATPRSARAPTSAPARSSPTTTACTSTAPTSAGTPARRSNNTFVAPVEIGDGAATGAGTVVRRDVPPGALAVRAGPQRDIEGWALRKRAGTPRPRQPPRPQLSRGGATSHDGPRPSWPTTAGGRHSSSIAAIAPTEELPRVSGLKRTTEKNLMVFTGRAHPELAEEVAELLGTGLVPTSAYEFANSEIYVRFEESVRGCDAFVIQSHTAPVNEWIMEHLIMVDALKRASAKRITVVHAVLRLRPPGQEAPRPRADLGAADGRPVQDRRRRPADRGRPAHRADPGLLRRPGRPPDGAADPRRATSKRSTATSSSPSSRRTPAGSRSPSSGRPGSAVPRWRSSTRPATSTGPTSPSPTAWSVTSRAGSACWSTT